MKTVSIVLLLVIASLTFAQTFVQRGVCVFRKTATYDKEVNGQVVFDVQDNVATIILNVASGLPANKSLGFHVHQEGFLGSPDGLGAGPHFNPNGSAHGYPTYEQYHVGDMGNITTDTNGAVSVTFQQNLIRLNGSSSVIGRTVIIHGGADDGVTPNTGGAGARIAQCIIGIMEVSAPNVNTAVADNSGNTGATVELLPTSATLGNNRQISGRVVVSSFTGTSIRLCGFAPQTALSIAVGQNGDLTDNLANLGALTSIANVTVVAGVVNAVNLNIPQLQITGANSVVGRSVIVFEGNDINNATARVLVGVIGAITTNVTTPACNVTIGACYLKPTANSQVTGTIVITHLANDNEGVYLSGAINGLPNTTHAWHVHQYGYIGTPDASGTGSHFNPFNTSHGLPFNDNRHIGDMGNLNATAGTVVFNNQYFAPSALVNGFSGASSIIGKAIVIHTGVDDGTGATGNAGGRLAQCVIGIANAGLINSAFTNAAVSDAAGPTATCELFAVGSSGVSGRIIFNEVGNGMQVTGRVCGLAPDSNHGFHVHQFGDLTGAALNTNIGTHYNPADVAHGYPTSTVHHLGDMGNITASGNGTVEVNILLPSPTMSPYGPRSIVGRAVVIHANADDGGQPTGNAGSPIATCVIGYVPTANVNLDNVICPALTPTPTPVDTTTTTGAPVPSSSTGTPTPTPQKSSANVLCFNMFLIAMIFVALL